MLSFSHFHELDPDAYRVTMELHARAEREELAIAFVFRWMAFNGWMAAVSGEERDFAMIATMATEQRIMRRSRARGRTIGYQSSHEMLHGIARRQRR